MEIEKERLVLLRKQFPDCEVERVSIRGIGNETYESIRISCVGRRKTCFLTLDGTCLRDQQLTEWLNDKRQISIEEIAKQRRECKCTCNNYHRRD